MNSQFFFAGPKSKCTNCRGLSCLIRGLMKSACWQEDILLVLFLWFAVHDYKGGDHFSLMNEPKYRVGTSASMPGSCGITIFYVGQLGTVCLCHCSYTHNGIRTAVRLYSSLKLFCCLSLAFAIFARLTESWAADFCGCHFDFLPNG